ncbi:unnamed protein product [Pylaiella littoralis]
MTPRPGGTATTPGSSGRPAPGQSRETSSRLGARGTGIERPKAGIERPKPGTAERARRAAAGPRMSPPSAGAASTPPPSGQQSSLHRTSSKSSLRGAVSAGKSSSERLSRQQLQQQQQQQQQQHRTTVATLAARDRAAAAAAHPVPHKRMHQGEELDSIDGFSPTVSVHSLPPAPSPPPTPLQRAASSRRPAGAKAAAGAAADARTYSRSGSSASLRDGLGGGAVSTAAAAAAVGSGGGSGVAPASIADVVSKVMGDTAAIADAQESPPSVAPSTWGWDGDGTAAAPTGSPAREGCGDSRRAMDCSPSSAASDSPVVPVSVGPVARGGRGGGEGRPALSRKSSSASVYATPESSGEPELSSGLSSLALSDERRPRSNSRSQETTALEVSSAGGVGTQQLVTLADAGRMMAPLVAKEVEKEAKKIEIRMQNEMNAALRTMRSEMEAIDREGLMARVAMEKRLKTGIKRLLDRIDHLERRFAKMEREDRKRLALEASAAPPSSSLTSPAIEAATAAVVGSSAGTAPAALTDGLGGVGGGDLPSPSSEDKGGRTTAASRSKRVGGDGGGYQSAAVIAARAAAAADAPESRPLVLKDAWGSGGSGGGRGGGGFSAVSSTVASDEEFSESGDETEADIVRMLEEKMAALEGKLLGHEERQRSDPRAGEGGLAVSSAVWA